MPEFKMRNTELGPLSEMFTGLGVIAGIEEQKVAQKVLEDGADFMRGAVPHSSGELAASIDVQPVTTYLFALKETAARGSVGSSLVRARYVNEGTGVDGPFKTPVIVTRPSRRNPNRPGAMMWVEDGAMTFRRKVKFNHSEKIQKSRGYVGRTDEYMKLRTRELLGEMKIAIKDYTKIFTGNSVRRP